MTTINQRSFSGGEISPFLYARVDISKYITGLRTCRNFYVLRHGGVSNRPGSGFVCEVKDSSKATRIIPFIFNSDQTYVIELGNLYARFIKNGVQVREATKTITGITQATPAVVTSNAHGYSNGDEVYITSVLGMLQVNNRNFKVAGVTANTFQLYLMDGVTPLNSTVYGAYTSGGTSARVYQVTTPYLEAELFDINYVQSADVITMVHPNHEPAELSRLGDTNWTFSNISFIPIIGGPLNVGTTEGGAGGTNTYRYKVTAIDAETKEESLPGLSTASFTITNITNANPAVVTVVGVLNYEQDEEVYIDGVVGMPEVNKRIFTYNPLTATTFELTGVNSTNYGTYVSGGLVYTTWAKVLTAAAPTPSAPHTITWSKVATAREYNVYKEINGLFGLIAIAIGSSALDIGVAPDTSITPPTWRNPFLGDDNFPSAVTYIQQRLAFANTNNDPEKIYLSRTGNFTNYTTSSPIQSDDSITFQMAGKQVNEVKNMIDIGRFVIFTTGGEWSATGGSDGPITPTTINTKQHSYNGSGSLPPIIVAGAAIYQQARGSIVRDLGFNFDVDGYSGNDLTIFSSHLFDDYTLVDWTYQQIPHSIVWAARSDGKLLGLTYVREQQILAWHRHDFENGAVESVTAIPGGNEDALYLVINRTIGGVEKRYIEKFASRSVTDINEIKILDSSLTYDGRNTNLAHTMTLSGGTTWVYTETLTLTSSASFFTSSDIGNAIHLYGTDGTLIRCTITAYTSATVVSVKPHMTVPVAMRSVALNEWDRAVDSLVGLWHLEGQAVSVFADGFVVASPNNDSYEMITVSSGSITLDRPYSVIHVGLPITADIETLDIDSANSSPMIEKNKICTAVNLYVQGSRGVFAGAKPPTDDDADPLDGLNELKIRNDEGYDDPISLKTGPVSVTISGTWNDNGRVFVRQVDPVPLTILSVAPSGWMPFWR